MWKETQKKSKAARKMLGHPWISIKSQIFMRGLRITTERCPVHKKIRACTESVHNHCVLS